MNTNRPTEGNAVIDGTETPFVARRLSRAVTLWSTANPDQPALLEVYINKDDAVPPIDSVTAERGEIYTRLSLPEGTFQCIMDIVQDLSYIDSPRRTS